MVQTGPKTQFGGENIGLFRVVYQLWIAEMVKNDPITPAPRQSPIEINNLRGFTSIINSISIRVILIIVIKKMSKVVSNSKKKGCNNGRVVV